MRMRLNVRQVSMATAAVLGIACSKSGTSDAERPATLVGSWMGVDNSGGDVVNPDPIVLTLAPDGSALFSRRKGGVATAPMDSTVRFARWRVSIDPATKAVLLCLQATDAGTPSCDPIVAQAGDSLVLALRNLSSVLGGRIPTVLRRSR
jgi:hypothetical protein